MSWPAPKNSRAQVDRAGEALFTIDTNTAEWTKAVDIVQNWRDCHQYPLYAIRLTLHRRAKRFCEDPLIAYRLKRLVSIFIKLRDTSMRLTQMQDLGGCRAVMPTLRDARMLVRLYQAQSKHGRTDRPVLEYVDNYVRMPKHDGYRGYHLIFKYQSDSEKKRVYNKQRIEIQVRSQLQHTWATTVETAQLFTGQALKSPKKQAHEDWIRFFAVSSAAFAVREKARPVPGVSSNRDIIARELRTISKRTSILNKLELWNESMRQVQTERTTSNATTFLLRLDTGEMSLKVSQYMFSESAQAQAAYKKQEEETSGDPNINVVLVSVTALDDLRHAYPNYYVDTREFLQAIRREMSR